MLEIFAKILGVWSGAKNRGKEWEKILEEEREVSLAFYVSVKDEHYYEFKFLKTHFVQSLIRIPSSLSKCLILFVTKVIF